MTLYNVLGGLLVAIPFAIIFGAVSAIEGVRATLLIFGVSILGTLMVVLTLGAFLLVGGL